MSAEYKVGTPADIYYADTKVRGLRVPGGWSLETDWASFLSDDVVSDVRPLVVLDPDDREQMDAFCKRLVEVANAEREIALATSGIHPDTVAAALRSLTRPPKPPEPQGRYAVVVAIGGDEWVRDGLDSDLAHDGPWWNATQARECAGTQTRRADYADIDVVRVLSEGVQP